jgi:hypothetical protein
MPRDATAKSVRRSAAAKNRLGVAGKRPLCRTKPVRGTGNFLLDGLKEISVHGTET